MAKQINQDIDSEDVVLQKMKEENIPMTRDNYLALAYFGDVPEVLDAEAEAELPEQFQMDPPEVFD
jgi:hypothetical protein